MNNYFIDTNIIMYAAGKPHKYKKPCLNTLQEIKDKEIVGVIDTEVIQEIVYRFHYIDMIDEGIELAWSLLDLEPLVHPVTLEHSKTALFFGAKYKNQKISPRDFIHLAVMVNNDIGSIISTDTHFDLFEEVQRIDPTEMG